MPIYAYRCESCGHAKDVLQKISDAPLTVCPQCGAEAFRKQLTAAGFQLKGSGWYVTDFRNNGNAAGGAPAAKPGESAPAPAGDAAASPAPAPAPAAATAAVAPAASPTPSTPSSGST
ncbi:FmdB family zinc ribbon protein [Pseudorhodoferax sp. Leaf274]|uniref:FmdB family zinc ribbon protein n=1 Tax=Pseudorhodoferax sp. Leaf274 TaxID=1736318 RepID=UPI000702ACEF|nr:FmdB family zinc ribbon protein [Pseudorhodoferax sp. Leaf274]KQP43239.1 FmdB family transcriptional regulator [Pseudorhodoferax sp. Leaf274]